MAGPSCMNHTLNGILYQDMTEFQRLMIYKRIYHPQWDACEDDIPTSYNEAKDMMEDLGQVLATMFNSSKMPRNRIFGIIDYMVGAEEDRKEPSWLLDNITTMLLFSSGSMIKHYLIYLNNKNSLLTVSDIISSMVIVCDRMDNDLAPKGKPGVNSILDWVFSEFPSHKKNKLYSDFWQEIIDRCKEEDVSGGMITQLGSYLSEEAFFDDPALQDTGAEE
ncbi:uncharacterized protein LOC111699830 isoform X2 [Eurytemora carolleeae]|uniref:uncharacterized protein LOC111699830 isoform X2 n=1 Tax=Eurytemora carolleeae TaxID=1294199 RepID=UPI000C780836|nr:uncharacterized protein LOC111699830 isoform X2 [Eurytemora carolleeae]|eukprot:XP_023326335.1 uncharacterized protein LOC111699830 isoform X2 [Eurytemora affinis]